MYISTTFVADNLYQESGGKKMGKKLILKDDFVIPKGTKFELIPSNTVRTYGEGNYEAIIAT